MSWGINTLQIRMTTFCGDGFRLDFLPLNSDNEWQVVSIRRSGLFQQDFCTAIAGANSSARNARWHFNFAIEELEEPYWTCVSKQYEKVFL